jgi:hypothetical protein
MPFIPESSLPAGHACATSSHDSSMTWNMQGTFVSECLYESNISGREPKADAGAARPCDRPVLGRSPSMT